MFLSTFHTIKNPLFLRGARFSQRKREHGPENHQAKSNILKEGEKMDDLAWYSGPLISLDI